MVDIAGGVAPVVPGSETLNVPLAVPVPPSSELAEVRPTVTDLDVVHNTVNSTLDGPLELSQNRFTTTITPSLVDSQALRVVPETTHTALVTGAGSGLGREYCLYLAELGWHIAICDINDEGSRETLEMVRRLN